MGENEKKETGSLENLGRLQQEIGVEPEPGAQPGQLPPGVSDEDVENIDDITVTPEELAAAVIEYMNAELVGLGLKPIGTLQRLLFKMSIVGFSRKHNIESYSVSAYPEIGLILSVVWIGTVKVREYKILHPKNPAPKPEPVERKPEA